MGLVKDFLNAVAKQALVDESFRRGQNGEPPLAGLSSEEMIEIANDAYEKGQRSALIKFGNKIIDGNKKDS